MLLKDIGCNKYSIIVGVLWWMTLRLRVV